MLARVRSNLISITDTSITQEISRVLGAQCQEKGTKTEYLKVREDQVRRDPIIITSITLITNIYVTWTTS